MGDAHISRPGRSASSPSTQAFLSLVQSLVETAVYTDSSLVTSADQHLRMRKMAGFVAKRGISASALAKCATDACALDLDMKHRKSSLEVNVSLRSFFLVRRPRGRWQRELLRGSFWRPHAVRASSSSASFRIPRRTNGGGGENSNVAEHTTPLATLTACILWPCLAGWTSRFASATRQCVRHKLLGLEAEQESCREKHW